MIAQPIVNSDRAIELARIVAARICSNADCLDLTPGLAQGACGTALLMHALETVDPGKHWEGATREHMQLAALALKRSPSDERLTDGWTGLLAAARAIGGKTNRYSTLRGQLGAMLLSRDAGTPESYIGLCNVLGDATHDLVSRHIVRIAAACADGTIPYHHPGGHDSCRLEVDHGMRAAIIAIARQYRNSAVSQDVENACAAFNAQAAPFYDEPSSCRCNCNLRDIAALWAAGRSTWNREQMERMVEILASLDLSRFRDRDFSLRSGKAGTALIFQRVAELTRDYRLQKRAHDLFQEVIEGFDPELPFGYADTPGLFSGATGVALSLLYAAGATTYSWFPLIGLV